MENEEKSVARRNETAVAEKQSTESIEAERHKRHKIEWTAVIGFLAVIGACVGLIWAIKWLIMWPVWILYFVGVFFYALRINRAFKEKDYKYAWSRIWALVAIGAILLLLAIIF